MKKALIEKTFPLRDVSEESAREKNIKSGHISTLHIWWARKPLASSRATIYASLVGAGDELEEIKRREFIKKLCKWENTNDLNTISRARKDILHEHGHPPRVLDPFGGGGSIPLEALRLGCETHSMDYNPVAVLIQKCTLEYPQKYAGSGTGWSEGENRLVRDVKRWGEWVFREAAGELRRFYPADDDGSVPVAYIWARTLPCQNPSCTAEIPLMRRFWLSRTNKNKIALKTVIEGDRIDFEMVEDPDFDPGKGTISRAIVTCPVCGSTIKADDTRRLFQEGKSGERLIAVVTSHPDRRGKEYRLPTEDDMKIFLEAEKHLEKKREKLMDEWLIDPIPDEPIPPENRRSVNVPGYGMLKWGDLFNPRQKLSLITFIEMIRNAYEEMIREGYDEEYAKIITTYLAMILGKLADWNSALCYWRPDQERNAHVFRRHAVPMVFDYGERNPLMGKLMRPETISKVLDNLSMIPEVKGHTPNVVKASATSIPYPDNYFDGIFTDPPYYDNVPYSYLSDYFHVWLKRALGDLYPELFLTSLTTKADEMVAYTHEKSKAEANQQFEDMIRKSFQEIHRILKPGGIANIVYAHKTAAGWETVINALLESGLTVTASWPINTEMRARLMAQKSAALRSSIYIVARKPDEEKGTGFYEEVKAELKEKLHEKLESLWMEGVSGPDFFISAIGGGLEVIGGYDSILTYSGEKVTASRLLEDIRSLAADFAIKQILENGFADELSPLTRFYLFYRWNFGNNKVDFDDARLLASSLGIDLQNEKDGFIRISGSKVTVLGPDERKPDKIKPKDLIDVLHLACIHWSRGETGRMESVLTESGYGSMDSFYRVAQALIESLPDCSEKKWLEGLTLNREELMRKTAETERQQKLP